MSFLAAATSSGNPTTTFTLTIPASVVAGDDLYTFVFSRGHTAVDPDVTVVDDDTGGNTWAKKSEDTNHKLTVWHKKATVASASKTITVDLALTSTSGIVAAWSHGTLGDPTAGAVAEVNAPGDESHAGMTPTVTGSEIIFVVGSATSTLDVASVTCTTPGALVQRAGTASTGGGGALVSLWSRPQIGAATVTGAITWAQTNAAGAAIAFAISPEIQTPGIEFPRRKRSTLLTDAARIFAYPLGYIPAANLDFSPYKPNALKDAGTALRANQQQLGAMYTSPQSTARVNPAGTMFRVTDRRTFDRVLSIGEVAGSGGGLVAGGGAWPDRRRRAGIIVRHILQGA